MHPAVPLCPTQEKKLTDLQDRPAFICDLDDTLVYCGIFYDLAKEKFYNFMSGLGMDRHDAEKQFRKLEFLSSREQGAGYRHDRFPTNMVKVYRGWCKEKGHPVTPDIEQELIKIGYSVYESTFEPLPGAKEMLTDLSHDYQLFVYTKGNQELQMKKILQADLDHFFQGVWITDRKVPSSLTIFMLKARISSDSCWVLGNSVRSDILPAHEVGVPEHQLIFLNTYEWEEDYGSLPDGVHTINSLSEVAELTRRLVLPYDDYPSAE